MKTVERFLYILFHLIDKPQFDRFPCESIRRGPHRQRIPTFISKVDRSVQGRSYGCAAAEADRMN
jgi:hypothetical protein